MQLLLKIKNFFASWPILKIIFLGLILRLVAAMFFTHTFDSFNIIALSKSITDTGGLIDGLNKIGDVQLYGRIYYQIIGFWMMLLEKLSLLHLSFIFDTKPYVGTGIGYLEGFPWMGPQIYQLFLIKLIQFVFDIPFLFFLLGITNLIKPVGKKSMAWFWAINPLFIYVGYVIFQSDLAMVSMLTGGVYLVLLSGKNSNKINPYSILALLLLAIGAILKQVPLLIVPFALLQLSGSIRQGILYLVLFFLFYFIGYQPWSIDSLLIKKHFLTSTESMALFNFTLNGLNIFFLLYIITLSTFAYIRRLGKVSPNIFIAFVLLVISVIYLSEDIGFFFIQFSIWAMPFIALLSLSDSFFTIFLLGNLIGFYIRVLSDNSILSGSMAVAFGEVFTKLPTYHEIIGKIVPMDIVTKFLTTLFMMLFGLLIFYIYYTLQKKLYLRSIEIIRKKLNISLTLMATVIFTIFISVGIIELYYMTHHVQLTNYVFQNTQKTTLTQEGILLHIVNKEDQSITGLNLLLQPASIKNNGSIIFEAINPKTHQTLTTGKINDLSLPDKKAYSPLVFKHKIKAKKFDILVKKDSSANEVSIFKTDQYSYATSSLPNYDSFYLNRPVLVSPTKQMVDMNITGIYSIGDLLQNFTGQISKKPVFFLIYFSLLSLGVIALFIPWGHKLKDKIHFAQQLP